MYSISNDIRHTRLFIFILIYLYICFIKFADTIPKNSWIGASLRYREVAELVQLGDTVGKNLQFHFFGKFWKIHFTEKYFPNVCFCERMFYYQYTS